MAVVAPIPRPTVNTIVAVSAGVLARFLAERRISRRKVLTLMLACRDFDHLVLDELTEASEDEDRRYS